MKHMDEKGMLAVNKCRSELNLHVEEGQRPTVHLVSPPLFTATINTN